MKAIIHRAYGPPGEVLALEDVGTPACGDDHVLVRVRAASVNPADWHMVRGEPYVAGLQACPDPARHARDDQRGVQRSLGRTS
jgi:NADPH:quinone reductase-like Zn-dependent oxidoreductase